MMLAKTLQETSKFQNEHTLYKKELVLRQKSLRETVWSLGQVVIGFLAAKRSSVGQLTLAGKLILEDFTDKTPQIDAYRQWLKKSIELTGRLQITQATFSLTQSQNQIKKQSRIAQALATIPEREPEIEVFNCKNRPHRPISPYIEPVLSVESSDKSIQLIEDPRMKDFHLIPLKRQRPDD